MQNLFNPRLNPAAVLLKSKIAVSSFIFYIHLYVHHQLQQQLKQQPFYLLITLGGGLSNYHPRANVHPPHKILLIAAQRFTNLFNNTAQLMMMAAHMHLYTDTHWYICTLII